MKLGCAAEAPCVGPKPLPSLRRSVSETLLPFLQAQENPNPPEIDDVQRGAQTTAGTLLFHTAKRTVVNLDMRNQHCRTQSFCSHTASAVQYINASPRFR